MKKEERVILTTQKEQVKLTKCIEEGQPAIDVTFPDETEDDEGYKIEAKLTLGFYRETDRDEAFLRWDTTMADNLVAEAKKETERALSEIGARLD